MVVKMRQTSINKAKKEIWINLQALVGDPDYWETTILDDNWNEAAFDKALTSIFWQIEKKL